jgi:basic membrane lipoprotein Med (substrate-binding protein (PBP1-ABC) superfamily)
MSRIIVGAAALTLLVPSAVFAQQFEPGATPRPRLLEGVKTAVITSALTDPVVNEVIDTTARFAHKELGGIASNRKKNGFFPSSQPTGQDVVRTTLDFAKAEEVNVIVITGGDSQSTVSIARNFPQTVYLDIAQPQPCIDSDGRSDPSGTCEGSTFAIPSNYMAVNFEVEDAAYLAGVIAASASRSDRLGIISGLADCEECNRYIQGFILGAQGVKPDIDIEMAFLADDDEAEAFGDPTTAKTFAKAFIDVHQPDVLLPIARGASRGMIEAACEAGILAVGTDIDVSVVHPDLAECVLASITKDMEYAVRESVFRFANSDLQPTWDLGLEDGYVDLTDEWTRLPTMPVDATERYADAREAIIIDQIDACPSTCGAPFGPGLGDDAEGGDGEADPDAPSEDG